VKKAIGFYPSPDLDTVGTQVVSHAGAVLLTEAIVAVHRIAAWASVAQARDAMNRTTKKRPPTCGNHVEPGHAPGHGTAKILEHGADFPKRAALGNRTPDLRITRNPVTAAAVRWYNCDVGRVWQRVDPPVLVLRYPPTPK